MKTYVECITVDAEGGSASDVFNIKMRYIMSLIEADEWYAKSVGFLPWYTGWLVRPVQDALTGWALWDNQAVMIGLYKVAAYGNVEVDYT